MDGQRSDLLPQASLVDAILGHRKDGAVMTLCQTSTAAFITQIMETGRLSDLLRSIQAATGDPEAISNITEMMSREAGLRDAGDEALAQALLLEAEARGEDVARLNTAISDERQARESGAGELTSGVGAIDKRTSQVDTSEANILAEVVDDYGFKQFLILSDGRIVSPYFDTEDSSLDEDAIRLTSRDASCLLAEISGGRIRNGIYDLNDENPDRVVLETGTPYGTFRLFDSSGATPTQIEPPIEQEATFVTTPAVQSCNASVSEYLIAVDSSSSTIVKSGELSYFGGSVTLAAPSTGTITDEALTIIYNATLSFTHAGSGGKLSCANVSNVMVRDAGTNAPLAQGVDYLVEPMHGAIQRASSGPALNVLVDYSWSHRRYDLVCLDRETHALSVVQGGESPRDVAERLPTAISSRQIPLFSARVIAGEVTLIPVWDVNNGYRRVFSSELDELRLSNKRALRATLKRLRSGEGVTIAGYGDSIVAASIGLDKDRPEFFGSGGGIDPAIIAALPRYDFNDGTGPVHVKASHIWVAITELEKSYSSPISYINLGVGGTRSNAEAGNGLDSARLAGLTGSGAHLAILHFGMNEIGSASTEENMIAIATACRSAGMDVVIMGVPRPNARTPFSYRDWLLTNRALAAAARHTGSAFMSTELLVSDAALSAFGIDPRDLCSQNYFNHPGVAEYQMYGAALASVLIEE